MSDTDQHKQRVDAARQRARAFREGELAKASNERPGATQTTAEKQSSDDERNRDRTRQVLR